MERDGSLGLRHPSFFLLVCNSPRLFTMHTYYILEWVKMENHILGPKSEFLSFPLLKTFPKLSIVTVIRFNTTDETIPSLAVSLFAGVLVPGRSPVDDPSGLVLTLSPLVASWHQTLSNGYRHLCIKHRYTYLMFYTHSTSTAEGQIRAKQNVFLSEVQNVIHYLNAHSTAVDWGKWSWMSREGRHVCIKENL